VDLIGARDYEIKVDISQENLRVYNLTLQDVANRIREAAVEIPGGFLETPGGDLLLRMRDRRDTAAEIGRIPIITTPAGGVLLLDDIATVSEGFADSNRYGFYNGKRSVELGVFRVGDQTPIGVSRSVRNAMAEIGPDLPPGISYEINRDSSNIYQQRLDLLRKNALLGLCLVLLFLGIFLEFRLAFWVTMGIPISFLGALMFLPGLGATINMISIFAFILALGIVVDDAIVCGENIYEYRQSMGWVEAAIRGARDVAVPIQFSILTNMIAFLPIYFMPGTIGKVWNAIPVVVITVFAISWVESLFILPSHLAYARPRPAGRLARLQQYFDGLLSLFIDRIYRPSLELSLRLRWFTLAAAVVTLMLVFAYVFSGRIGMILMPRIEADRAVVTAVLPFGSPLARVMTVQDHLLRAIEEMVAENGGNSLVTGTFALIDENQVEISAYLTEPEVRPLNTTEVTRLWRERAGNVPGLQSLRFEADRGGIGSAASLTVELAHRDIATLERASTALAEQLAGFANVKDIDSGVSAGKQQLDFRITAAGQSLGLTSDEVARQVRNAFHGAEALQQQRGRNEVKVRVRLPESERVSEFNVENLMISTPGGRYVPLLQVAEVERGRAYTTINRRNARRTMTVTADVVPMGETNQVLAVLDSIILPQLVRDYPGLTHAYEGRQADLRDSMRSLFAGFALAMVVIYFLLAVPFRSYVQPLIVMVAIPFGMVGAVFGHLLMGYNLSLMSMMGIVALSGVVVNASLVLIDYANRQRLEGQSALAAIQTASLRRFRPVLLTTITTFGGLAPMIFETSRQARFLIPMALSLGFGVLFATAVTLVIVPSLYVLLEDVAGSREEL
jgi:multidrug efflux pump subunit AcrB